MSDWDASDDETTKVATAPAVVAPKKAKKWEGEDEEDDGPVVSPHSTSVNLHAPHSLDSHACTHLGPLDTLE